MSSFQQRNLHEPGPPELYRSHFEYEVHQHNPWLHFEALSYKVRHNGAERTHYPDFLLPDHVAKSGGMIVVEAKGYLREKDAAKILAFRQQYPQIDYRMILYSDKSAVENSNKTIGQWCREHSIPYVVGLWIPKSWINDQYH